MLLDAEDKSIDPKSDKEFCENSELAEAGLQSAEMPLVLGAIKVTFDEVVLIEE